jgi:two-component system chemotaxis response regulator CheY
MPKVLVVDDAAFMRASLRKILEPAGFEVSEAENGAVAVNTYQEVAPDVVTMDITMPEKDGIQAVKEIRALDPAAKIIMVSALGQENMVKQAILSGAKDFVVKPFDGERVVESIKKAMG